MIFVYVLQSLKDHRYYIGITKDLKTRLTKHNKGGVRSTKNRRPFIIVHSETFENYKDARFREIEIKSFKGGSQFKQLIGI